MNTQARLAPLVRAAGKFNAQKGMPGFWVSRAAAELEYLTGLYDQRGETVPEEIFAAADGLIGTLQRQGDLLEQDVLDMEAKLSRYGKTAKSIRVWCAGHAHIDMNWMWGFPETVGITIDTFQTVLNLMREYPDFVFSQSQASTYEIIEKYAPSMLPEIAQRVREGRWELTASQWVEGDKNMAGTEALCRHMLYTKQYLHKLFGVDPDSLDLDFEPDTFGHNENMPEILAQGGVKYLYHCRGHKGEILYRWRAPSGQEVLTFWDPEWYLTHGMGWNIARYMPKWAREMGVNEILWPYGVGDHGGGPTRRDIEHILEMRSWPLMPDFRFGRIRDFFRAVEPVRESLPVLQQEMNFVFTGCYTSEARTKLYNRLGEDRLGDSEALCAMAKAAGVLPAAMADTSEGWKNVLFNQFHDILPGSGVPETYRYAAGRFQDAMATATGNANRALHALTGFVSTDKYAGDTDSESVAEGAGVGVRVMETPTRANAVPSAYGFGETSRGGGSVRPFVVLNPTQYDRNETAQLSLWDWPLAPEETEIRDGEGNLIPYTVVHQDAGPWSTYGHKHMRLAFPCKVPAFGWANYYVRASEMPTPLPDDLFLNPRVHTMEDGVRVLENDRIRAVLDSRTMAVLSLTEKKTGRELVSAGRPGGVFRLVQEQSNDSSAWVVGAYRSIRDLNETGEMRVTAEHLEGIYKWIDHTVKFGRSSLQVRVSLGAEETMLRWDVLADWHEVGEPGGLTPQLQFYAPAAYPVKEYRYDEAAGSIVRPALGHDVPALSYAAALGEGDSCLMLTTNCKYGYRGDGDAVLVDLLRASIGPDRYPDLGYHQFAIGLGAVENSPVAMDAQSTVFSHGLCVQPTDIHAGKTAQSGAFLRAEGCRVYGVKESEDKSGIVLRLGNLTDAPAEGKVAAGKFGTAFLADVLERTSEAAASVTIPPHALRTVVLKLNN